MVIKYIEKSPTGRAKCVRCKNIIPKGAKRAVYKGSRFGHEVTYYYCKKCAIKSLNEDIKEISKLKRELR